LKHSINDYSRIQDPEGLIPQDEPVFLLRAQDIAASFAVRSWAQRLDQLGGDQKMVRAALGVAQEMEDWPVKKMPEGRPWGLLRKWKIGPVKKMPDLPVEQVAPESPSPKKNGNGNGPGSPPPPEKEPNPETPPPEQ